jgi:hypothetical protein
MTMDADEPVDVLAGLEKEYPDLCLNSLCDMREKGDELARAVEALIEAAPTLSVNSSSPVIRMLLGDINWAVREWHRTAFEYCGEIA